MIGPSRFRAFATIKITKNWSIRLRWIRISNSEEILRTCWKTRAQKKMILTDRQNQSPECESWQRGLFILRPRNSPRSARIILCHPDEVWANPRMLSRNHTYLGQTLMGLAALGKTTHQTFQRCKRLHRLCRKWTLPRNWPRLSPGWKIITAGKVVKIRVLPATRALTVCGQSKSWSKKFNPRLSITRRGIPWEINLAGKNS